MYMNSVFSDSRSEFLAVVTCWWATPAKFEAISSGPTPTLGCGIRWGGLDTPWFPDES